MATLNEGDFTLIAYGGLGREIILMVRNKVLSPRFNKISSFDTQTPVHHIEITNQSFINQNDASWNIRLFYASQDKIIHILSLTILFKSDGNISCNLYNSQKLYGHQGYIRCLALNNDESLISAGDDFIVKEWSLNTLELGGKDVINIYEGHLDDVICLDSKYGWIVSGSKDRTIMIKPSQKISKKSQQHKIEKIQISSIVKSVLILNEFTILIGCGNGELVNLKREDNYWVIESSLKLHSKPIQKIQQQDDLIITCSSDSINSLSIHRLEFKKCCKK